MTNANGANRGPHRRAVGWLAGAALLIPFFANAEWPYATEEASTLPEGRYSLSLGSSRTVQASEFQPGGRGVLRTAPEVEGTLGVGPNAEVSFQYAILWFDPDGHETEVHQTGDLRLWTKLALFPRLVEGLGLRFGVKLPNATDRHGLGTDETDFFTSLLADLPVGRAQVSLNAGFGILGSTAENQSQDDVFTWAGAVQLPLWGGWSAGFDGSGRAGPWGLRPTRHVASLGPVVTWRAGPFRLDVAGRRGVQDGLGWGWLAGVTYGRSSSPEGRTIQEGADTP